MFVELRVSRIVLSTRTMSHTKGKAWNYSVAYRGQLDVFIIDLMDPVSCF